MVTIEELDELAGKFIIGHKKLSPERLSILERIEKLRIEERAIENKKIRIKNLIDIMYKKIAVETE